MYVFKTHMKQNAIDTQINKIKQSKKIGLMTHVVVGYPTLDATEAIVNTMIKAGVDFIELQIPFSDPLVDGPAMMHANDIALENGTKTQDAFDLAQKLTKEFDIPFLFMGYYNSLFSRGIKLFCKQASDVGVSGLIFSDIPPEEEEKEGYLEACKSHDLYPIRLVSPASTDERLRINARVAKGFVYCVSRLGVTSAQSELDPRLEEYLKRVKKYFPTIPLAVGFGISKPEHIRALSKKAEIAIVGSAVIDIIRKHKTCDKDCLTEIADFLHYLRK